MQTMLDVVILLAWVASFALLARSIMAVNNHPKIAAGFLSHLYKLCLVVHSAGYFCIAVMTPVASMQWAMAGGALVLLSEGVMYVGRVAREYADETSRRVDSAFDVEL